MSEFNPTHKITRGNDEIIVMIDDEGRAYELIEWENETPADYELVDGEWLFQGEAFSGTVERLDGVDRAVALANAMMERAGLDACFVVREDGNVTDGGVVWDADDFDLDEAREAAETLINQAAQA